MKKISFTAFLAGLLLAAGCPAAANPPAQIHTILGVTEQSEGRYIFETDAGTNLEVSAGPASMAGALLSADAFSQEWHCAFAPADGGAYRLTGCSAVGMPGPLRMPAE